MALEYVTTDRGRQKLILDGYLYAHDRLCVDGREMWRCDRRNECKARIHTMNGFIIQRINEHTHTPEHERIAQIRNSDWIINTKRPQPQAATNEAVNNCVEMNRASSSGDKFTIAPKPRTEGPNEGGGMHSLEQSELSPEGAMAATTALLLSSNAGRRRRRHANAVSVYPCYGGGGEEPTLNNPIAPPIVTGAPLTFPIVSQSGAIPGEVLVSAPSTSSPHSSPSFFPESRKRTVDGTFARQSLSHATFSTGGVGSDGREEKMMSKLESILAAPQFNTKINFLTLKQETGENTEKSSQEQASPISSLNLLGHDNYNATEGIGTQQQLHEDDQLIFTDPPKFWSSVFHLGVFDDLYAEVTHQMDIMRRAFIGRPNLRSEVAYKLSEMVKLLECGVKVSNALQTKRILTQAQTQLLSNEIEELKRKTEERRKQQMETQFKAEMFAKLFGNIPSTPDNNCGDSRLSAEVLREGQEGDAPRPPTGTKDSPPTPRHSPSSPSVSPNEVPSSSVDI